MSRRGIPNSRLRPIPRRIVDKWKQPVEVSADGMRWKARHRPEANGISLLNWVLFADLREGDTIEVSATRERPPGLSAGRGFRTVRVRPDDGRRKVFSDRAIAIVKLFIAERASELTDGGLAGLFASIRYFGLWLAAHPQFLPAKRAFEWSDLTMRVAKAFLAAELQLPRQGSAVNGLRLLVKWGTHPESAVADFDESLYEAMRQLRLPNRAKAGAAALDDPRRGAFNADELADILAACEGFDVHQLGLSRPEERSAERGRATAWVLLHVGARPVQITALQKRDLVLTPLVQRDPSAPAKIHYYLRIKRVKQGHVEDEFLALPISQPCGTLLLALLDQHAPPDSPLLPWLHGVKSHRDAVSSVLRKFFACTDLRTRRLPRTLPSPPPASDVNRALEAVQSLTRKARDVFITAILHDVPPVRLARLTGPSEGCVRRANMLIARLYWARERLKRACPDLDVAAILRADREQRDPRYAFHRLPVFAYRFRYGLATARIRHGGSLRSVATFLGHADLQVVQGYIDNSPDIADSFQSATDWMLAPLVKLMNGRIDDPLMPSLNTAIPNLAPHLAGGRALPIIGSIGKCGKNGHCDKNPVVSCFTCNDYIARPDGAGTIRDLRSAFVSYLDSLGATASDMYVAQLHRAIRAMTEWIGHLEECEALHERTSARHTSRVLTA
jgi:integrase